MIAVTGLGAVSPLGRDPETLFARLCAGQSALSIVQGFPAKGPVAALGRRVTSSELALEVARQAMPDHRGGELAVVGASTSGDMSVGEKAFATRLRGEVLEDPSNLFFRQLCHAPTRAVAEALGASISFTLSTACTSGLCAIGAAADLVHSGLVPMALAVGADALCDITLAGFGTLGVYAPEPCRPFDRERQGMNIGEGAGVLEAVVAIGALRHQRLPPTVGCTDPEPELDIVLEAREAKIDAALTVNFAFGGNNAAAVFRRA